MKQNITLGLAVIAILIAVGAYGKPQPTPGGFGATADCSSNTCLTSLDVSGDSTVQAQFGVGTTTPTVNEISALDTSTTTLGLYSSTSGRGSCIQLKGTDNVLYRMYVGARGLATTSPGGVAGSFLGVWEPGSCE